MKKITRAFMILTVVAIALMTAGCGLGERVKESLEETYEVWYKYNGQAGLKIPVGASDDDSNGSYMENAEFYVYYDDDGLTVAVQSSKKENVELYGGLVSTTQTIYVGGTKHYSKSEFGPVRWTALIGSGNFEEDDEPKVYSSPEECIILTGNDSNSITIQWKKVLAQYLVNRLFS